MKYLIKLLILSIVAGIMFAFICYGNIPIEYKPTVLQVYILGIIVGSIGTNIN